MESKIEKLNLVVVCKIWNFNGFYLENKNIARKEERQISLRGIRYTKVRKEEKQMKYKEFYVVWEWKLQKIQIVI